MESVTRSYIAIDLKSFFASVECVERGLDPLTTNLVVADVSRTEKTICLAVTPSLKAYGIGGRARLFEVNQRLREVNAERRMNAPCHRLTGRSTSDVELKQHPDWTVDFIAATPRMALYIDYSTRIYDIYLKYVAPEDIFAYSIDEVFIDAMPYLSCYGMTPRELATTMIHDVLQHTGITATAGIGTNLYLCKVAMDIVAKHVPADVHGVRVAELDEMSYRRELWDHRPLTSFWRVGRGTAERLAKYGIDTMGKLARCSLQHEDFLYSLFGVNAELIIDHAWGWEPCTIADVKAYRPESSSYSNGQVLSSPYEPRKARVVALEMADAMALKLVAKHQLTDQLVLSLGGESADGIPHGKARVGYYHRGEALHATATLDEPTSSAHIIMDAVASLFDRLVTPDFFTRRINLSACRLVSSLEPRPSVPVQMDLFSDVDALEKERKQKEADLAKERRVQETIIGIKQKFGKNAILKGLNYEEGATARERNEQIGGHKA